MHQVFSLFYSLADLKHFLFLAQKPERIADTVTAKIVTPPIMSQNIVYDITQGGFTLYLLPGESAFIDFSSAYSAGGPNTQWTWIINGEDKKFPKNAWIGEVNNYNPLLFPKATLQLKLTNSAGEILGPLITVTSLVPPKITTPLPAQMTATEGEELEVSIVVTPVERSLITWGINNKTLPDHTPTIKILPTLDMDGREFGVLVLNPVGIATSSTTLYVKMAPWKIALIIIFVVLAVGGAAAGGFIFLKKKGYLNKKPEYIKAETEKGDFSDNDAFLDA